MNFDFKDVGAVVAVAGLIVGWALLWLSKREKAIEKGINDKRDFNHLVNNQLEISRGVANGFKDLEGEIRGVDNHVQGIENEVREVKAYLIRNSKPNEKGD
ncbi:MAG: hypothetical protein V7K27_01755 [Nostoc sp.]|uniref:hypothetical protein n=1 Tax=Nostoc sp. TaxID=1180 RepID=UPI002FF61F1A